MGTVPTIQGDSSQAQSSHISDGLVALSGITKPDKPAKWKGKIGYTFYPGTTSGSSLHRDMSGGGSAPSYSASGSPPSFSPASLPSTMPRCTRCRRSMCCCASLPGPIGIGLTRLTISNYYTPMRTSTRRTLIIFGSNGTSD